jgi:hypothetical protein
VAIHAAPDGPRLRFARDATARRPWGRGSTAAQ